MSLTSDISTDTINVKSYLSITAHYIKDGNLESIIVASKYLVGDHTSTNLQIAVEEVLSDWGIEKEKVACCVTDGAPNIVKTFKTIFGSDKHLHCFAHLINLMVNESLESCELVQDLIKKNVKETVTFFKQSVKNIDELCNEQKKQGRNDSECLKLIQDVRTRWNSTYFMLERFNFLHSYIVPLLTRTNGPSILGKQQMDEIRDCLPA